MSSRKRIRPMIQIIELSAEEFTPPGINLAPDTLLEVVFSPSFPRKKLNQNIKKRSVTKINFPLPGQEPKQTTPRLGSTRCSEHRLSVATSAYGGSELSFSVRKCKSSSLKLCDSCYQVIVSFDEKGQPVNGILENKKIICESCVYKRILQSIRG